MAKVVVERMGRKHTRLADVDLELIDIIEHTLRHRHESIHRTAEPPGERTVAGTRLVRNEVVKNTDDTSSAITTCQGGYRAEARAHKGQPELDDKQVGHLITDLSTHANPVERIARVHATCNLEIGRCRLFTILRLAREQEPGILQREGIDLHLVAFGLQLMGKTFVIDCQATAIGPSRAQKDYFHTRINAN